MKTINFKDFMDGSWNEKKEVKAYSFIPLPTASMFLNDGVLIIGVAGLVLVGLSLYERYLVKKGREYEAEAVSVFTGLAVPTIGIGSALYFLVWKNPLIKWL